MRGLVFPPFVLPNRDSTSSLVFLSTVNTLHTEIRQRSRIIRQLPFCKISILTCILQHRWMILWHMTFNLGMSSHCLSLQCFLIYFVHMGSCLCMITKPSYLERRSSWRMALLQYINTELSPDVWLWRNVTQRFLLRPYNAGLEVIKPAHFAASLSKTLGNTDICYLSRCTTAPTW